MDSNSLHAAAKAHLNGIGNSKEAKEIEEAVVQEFKQIDLLTNAAVGAALSTDKCATKRLSDFAHQICADFGRDGVIRAINLLCDQAIGPYGHTCVPLNVMGVDIDLSKVDVEDVPAFASVKNAAEAFLSARLNNHPHRLAEAQNTLTAQNMQSVLVVLARHLATIINKFAGYQADAYEAYDELSRPKTT